MLGADETSHCGRRLRYDLAASGAFEKAKRVLRGGSWNNNGRDLRCANRNRNEPDNRNDNIGFRLALAHTCWMAGIDQTLAICECVVFAFTIKTKAQSALVGDCCSIFSPNARSVVAF